MTMKLTERELNIVAGVFEALIEKPFSELNGYIGSDGEYDFTVTYVPWNASVALKWETSKGKKGDKYRSYRYLQTLERFIDEYELWKIRVFDMVEKNAQK